MKAGISLVASAGCVWGSVAAVVALVVVAAVARLW